MNTGANQQQGGSIGATAPGGRFTRTLFENTRASVLPMSAVAIILLAGMVGGGVDMGRAYQAQSRLQYACDAGVLAGRRAVDINGFDQTAQDKADAFFDANFQEGSDTTGTVFTPTSPDSGQTITGTATTQLDTTVMKIFGKDTIALSADCEASMSVSNSDITFVLDTTGSMACTAGMDAAACQTYINNNGYSETAHGGTARIADLRTAMNNFHTTVDNAISGTNVRARYAFVPYANTVNVGHLLPASYLADQVTIPSREVVYEKSVIGYENPNTTYDDGQSSYDYNGWNYYNSTRYYSQNSCLAVEPDDSGWYDNGSSSTGSPVVSYNDNDQRVTTTTTSIPQQYIRYTCYRFDYNNYRIVRFYYSRTRYEYEIVTEDPIYGPPTSNFETWRYTNLDFDSSQYKLFNTVSLNTGTNGTSESFTWNGCIEERETEASDTFSWSNLTGLSPSGALDLDIDQAPDVSDDSTKWKPLWSGLAYPRVKWNSGSGWYNYTQEAETFDYESGGTDYVGGFKSTAQCPDQAQLHQTMDSSAFSSFVSGLSPAGSTYHDIGLIWGGRLASPTGIFASTTTAPAPNGGNVEKHLIFMTDGFLQPTAFNHTAYGLEYWDPRVTDDGSTDQTTRHQARMLAVCEQIKSKGIRIWVIAFATALTTDLTQCASTGSAFPASDAASLNSAFQSIAQEVGELRITQ